MSGRHHTHMIDATNLKMNGHHRKHSFLSKAIDTKTKSTTNGKPTSDKTKSYNNITVAATATIPKTNDITSGSKASILNVAEMLLHGVADNEILDIWLRSIDCQELLDKFVASGYDMPTISRITPQDLTAIGVIDPVKRQKILSEIKKLNLQDGIPEFRPLNLKHWLSLIRLEHEYYESLCDQQVDTIEKLCEVTWEDYEELGITKLGHQKRLLLAIERLNELEMEARKESSKLISEPIYDVSPNQIVLVAPAENHTVNGPIIAKRSSTSELSTESGSIHSIYSAVSSQHRSNHTPAPEHRPLANTQNGFASNEIYCQTPNSNYMQLPNSHQIQTHHSQPTLPQQQFQSIPQQYQQHNVSHAPYVDCMPSRQCINQMPFNIAKLPKHQQILLQQSSIYATLTRQPHRAKQPPPVPIRTNSLKRESHTDNVNQNQTNGLVNGIPKFHSVIDNVSSRRLARGSQGYQIGAQTLITKHKSFSGNAYMEAFRAKYLAQNVHTQVSQQPQNVYGLIQPTQIINLAPPTDDIKLSYNHNVTQERAKREPHLYNSDDFDLSSDTNSTNSLVLNSVINSGKGSSSGDAISSQATLLRSMSNGSDEAPTSNLVSYSSQTHPGGQLHSINSQGAYSTLSQPSSNSSSNYSSASSTLHQASANITTGKDEEFPLPPSPLAVPDPDEQNDLGSSVNSTEKANFNDMNQNMMNFRIKT